MGIFRDRPNMASDNLYGGPPSRASQYSDAYVLNLLGSKTHGMADEGSYFSILNTTPGTGIAGHAAPTTADATKPILWIQNGGNRRIYLDYVTVRMTAIGANATTTDFSVFVDTGASKSTGGSAITPKNVNSDSVVSTAATVQIGATVLLNSSAVHVGHRRVRSVVPVVEDLYTFNFGGSEQNPPSANPTSGTLICTAYVNFPPVVIGPGDSFIFVEWGLSQSGAHSFDVEAGYWER